VLEPVRRRVLVVEDDPTVRDVVRRYLERVGFTVVQAGDGAGALDRFAEQRPDVVVLGLPGTTGLEVCRRLQHRRPDVPLIVVTSLGEQADGLVDLPLGADDYVAKPFSPRELVRRVQSVQGGRRPPGAAGGGGGPRPVQLADGDLVVRTDTGVARLADEELVLTARELDLLAHFMRHPAQVFGRGDLMRAVWGWDVQDHSTVTVHVARLRARVEPSPSRPRRIVTVWGAGYRYDLRACS
jgi:DNA-binding response OmpR family regulator